MRVSGRGFLAKVLGFGLLGFGLLGLGCKDVVEAPTSLVYSTNPASYLLNTAIATNSPTHSGGAIDTYAVSPALPAGLSLDTKTGLITGTPSAASPSAAYVVTATNTAGSTTASLAIEVIDPTITISTQPLDQSTVVGQTATFSITATGAGTLSYQWSRGGVAIASATAASYTTPATVLADNGSTYSVLVSSSLGTAVNSRTATLAVLATTPGLSTATDSMATARASATATLLASGKVLIVGGYNGTSLGSAELYDPTTGLFSTTGSLLVPREYHTATLLASGKVLIAGGDSFNAATASAELYDPATGAFTSTGSLGAARSDHSATLLPSGKVLLVGGRNLTVYQGTAELFDPATGTFSVTASAPLASRATHTATLLGSGKVLIAGGFRTGNLGTAELYDPTAGTFTATGSLSLPRANHTATLLGNGKVLMVGGASTAATELFDPTTGTFAATGNLLGVRDHLHASALLPSGKVLVSGGVGVGSPAPLPSRTEVYDPTTGTFTATGSLTTGREAHTATTLTNGKVLLAGGAGAGYLASAELYY